MRMSMAGWMLLGGLLALGTARADTFELKPRKIKITKKNADILPEVELRPISGMAVEKEPKYKSDAPQRFSHNFGADGSHRVHFVVDEKRGTGKGYDYIYADLEAAGDLTKCKKLPGKTNHRGYSYEDTNFATVQVPVPGGADAVPVALRFTTQKGNPTQSSLYLTPLAMLEGSVQVGDAKLKLMLFDANCNGAFGEAARLVSGKVQGDRVWIGKGSPKPEDAYSESLPLGKYYAHEGKFYTIVFPEAGVVEVAPAEVPVGTVKVSNPGFLLELVDRDSVLYVGSEESTEAAVPVGNWRVTNASFRRRYKGKLWELEGQPGSCSEGFNIKEGSVTEINAGPPLKIQISASTRRVGTGLVASLRFSIGGSAGETYQYLKEGGKKVDLPAVLIKDPRGKVVDEGHFEYG